MGCRQVSEVVSRLTHNDGCPAHEPDAHCNLRSILSLFEREREVGKCADFMSAVADIGEADKDRVGCDPFKL